MTVPRTEGSQPVLGEPGASPRDAAPVHLKYLEGIRGWAAIFVALHHAWQLVVTRPDLGPVPGWFTALTVFKFGGYAVPVFIVLSGYCLMLPIARSGRAELSGGIKQFAIRRARRILIPYYAALFGFVALIALYPRLAHPTQTQWDIALPALDAGSLLSHIALVHNWFQRWQWTIDPPMWSIGMEWQIYFVFALVLLPLWRRVGPVATVVIAFVAGLLPLLAGYRFASPWFLGLFGFGMFAASMNFTPRFAYTARNPLAWEVTCALAWGLAAVLTLAKISALAPPHPFTDTLVGLGTATLLIGCTRRLQTGRPLFGPARLLEHPVSVGLGTFSYSIYLLHYPIFAVVFFMVADRGLRPGPGFAVMVCIALPLSLLIAYGFHRLFERPFMTRGKAEQPRRPSIVAPAMQAERA